MSKLDDVLANLPDFARASVDRDSALQELAETRETIEPTVLPRLYQVETTSRCNLRCPFCPRTTDLLGSGKRDLNEVMPLERFERLLDMMPWVRSLELFHFGEPFMQRDIHRYIAACKMRGVYTVIASNLLPATYDKIDAAFDAGLDFLVMDVDSLDPVKYAMARVGGTLGKLKPIVEYILSRGRPRPYIVAQTIMLNEKPEYTLDEFIEWTGGLAPDEVRYKFLDSFRGEIVDKGGLPAEAVCREPFYGFTVHVNGNVVPCDRDWAGENVMGNVFEQTIEEIWNGPRYRAFRDQMKSTQKPAMCRACPEGTLINLRSQPMIQVNMFSGKEVQHDDLVPAAPAE